MATPVRRMVPTTVYLTPEQMEMFRVLSEKTRVPVAVYVREGMDMVLSKYFAAQTAQVVTAHAIMGLVPLAPRAGRRRM